MKVLFIGGTGTISMAISRKLLEQGHELYLINRGNRNAGLAVQLPGTGEWNRPKEILVDINKEEEAAKLLEGMQFDAVADLIDEDPARTDLQVAEILISQS